MEDGLFYDSCLDATDHWDDDWVLCPVCLARVEYVVFEDGDPGLKVLHQEVVTTKQ